MGVVCVEERRNINGIKKDRHFYIYQHATFYFLSSTYYFMAEILIFFFLIYKYSLHCNAIFNYMALQVRFAYTKVLTKMQ